MLYTIYLLGRRPFKANLPCELHYITAWIDDIRRANQPYIFFKKQGYSIDIPIVWAKTIYSIPMQVSRLEKYCSFLHIYLLYDLLHYGTISSTMKFRGADLRILLQG